MSKILFPERHPVHDFFVLDVMDVTPRSDIASMEHPIFSLSTKPDRRILRYKHDEQTIEIHPSTKGLATIFDKDIIIYAISKLMHMKNEGKEIGPEVRITTHDLLVSTNRSTGGIIYDRLEDALHRLAQTRIKTNIATGDEITTSNFGLIDWYDYNRKATGSSERLKYLDLKLSDWIYRAIQNAEVLPISRDYFRLRRPIDRRMYELSRKHCGKQPAWRVSMSLLQKKIGSKQEDRFFLKHLRELMSSDVLPDYQVSMKLDTVIFTRRDGSTGLASAPKAPAREREPSSLGDELDDAFASFASAMRSDARRKIVISWQAMEQVAAIAPGWDKEFLERTYTEWAQHLDAAKNEDARFLAWAKNFTKNMVPGERRRTKDEAQR